MILALDPGCTRSAVVRLAPLIEGSALLRIIDKGLEANAWVLSYLRHADPADTLVIEQVRSYGMAVGAEVFDTVFWSGRFAQAYRGPWVQMPRRDVKLHLCGSAKAKDANIRRAVLDLYGGKEAAIGKKASPGPLYGIKADLWAALALGLTYAQRDGSPRP